MFYDLSQSVEHGMPKVPGLPEVEVKKLLDKNKGHPANVMEIKINTHAGTHIDAPLHMLKDGKSLDGFDLEHFHGHGCAIDIERNEVSGIRAVDLEEAGGDIVQPQDILLVCTKWDKFYGTEQYFEHPYFTEDAGQWILEKKIKMVGVDLLNVDMPIHMRPEGYGTPFHHVLLGNNILIAENVTNLQNVVGCRLEIWALPIKVKNSDGALSRIVARKL